MGLTRERKGGGAKAGGGEREGERRRERSIRSLAHLHATENHSSDAKRESEREYTPGQACCSLLKQDNLTCCVPERDGSRDAPVRERNTLGTH